MADFIPVKEAIKLLCLSEGDIQLRKMGRYMAYSTYVWREMNMSSVKITVREKFKINKLTNSIDLPCDTLQVSGVSVEDRFGNKYPIFRNDRVNDDIVDISAIDSCSCSCGNKLCNTIKGYEAITQIYNEEMPDGSFSDFKCVTRKSVDDNGFLYEEKQYPERVYEEGVWVDVRIKTENKKLCKLQRDDKGCILDSEENIDSICNSCVGGKSDIPYGGNAMTYTPNKSKDEWVYYCSSKLEWLSIECGSFFSKKIGFNNVYNISELGNRLIFPRDFGFDSVIVRRYVDVSLKDLRIPYNALDCFHTGLKWYDTRYRDDKRMSGIAKDYERSFGQQQFQLLKDMNKYRIAELNEILIPKVYVPSYIPSDAMFWWGRESGLNSVWY